jgi:hypothetical protein
VEVQAQNPEDLIPQEHERAFRGSYKSFRLDSSKKLFDVDAYIAKVTPNIKKLIGEQLIELHSMKVQLHMWIMWRKPQKKLAFDLTEEEFQDAEEIGGTEVDDDILISMGFGSLMTEIFEGSDLDVILAQMFAYIKTRIAAPKMPESGFTIDHIMHLDVDFHKLVLTRGRSYIKLPKWILSKRAVINPKNEDDNECFKWAVIVALHHSEIGNDQQRISKLEPYVQKYNWKGLKFPMAVNKIGKFEENNPDVAVNVLFVHKKTIYTARRSEHHGKRSKHVNLLMIVDDDGNRHYTTIIDLSRLLSSMNREHNGEYFYCLNCMSGFSVESERDKH